MDLRISVPMTFMRSLGLRQFFYRKRKLIFLGPFLFKFAVHYLRNGPEDFGSDDIYEVPSHRPFLYIYITKYFWDHFFFQIRGHYLRIEPEDFGSDDISEVPDITRGQSQCAIWKSMQKVKRFFFLGIYIFLWVGPNFESPDRFKLR